MPFTPASSTSHNIKDYSLHIVKAGGIIIPVASIGNDSEAFSYKQDKEEKNILKKDLSGNGHWGFDPDNSGEVEITLFHTNPTNAQFQLLLGSTVAGRQIIIPGTFDFTVANNQGVTFLWGNKGKIKGQPSGNRGKDPSEIKWTIRFVELIVNESGMLPDV